MTCFKSKKLNGIEDGNNKGFVVMIRIFSTKVKESEGLVF